MMEICIGRMQMSLSQFWESEPREIYLAITGWHKQLQEAYRLAVEQSRIQSFYAVMPYSTKGGLKKPSDLYRVPWDPEDKVVKVTSQEFKQITQKWDDEMIGPDGKFR